MQKKKNQKLDTSQNLDAEDDNFVIGYSKLGLSRDQLPVTKSSTIQF